ncbi:MAG: acylase [Sediminicola sp.]
MKNWLLLICLALVACKTKSAQTERERWQRHADNTVIIRDDFGVPHIYGKTDADAVFGLLYAQCEDDFNRVEQNYIWATGRLAEVEGEEALYSDLRANLFMTEEEALSNYEKSPPWLKKLCDAFADGINYYLLTHPEVTPRLIARFEPWMPMYFSEGSIGGDIERISLKKIKEFYGGDMAIPTDTKVTDTLQRTEWEPQGSNGIALSGKMTRSGNAMLLINPHTSFFFRGEVHVVSEEGLNAYGAVTWGQFFVYQGFNEKTGWMHTSTYADIMDEFKESVTERDGRLMYRYGDSLRPVSASKIVLEYKDGDAIKQRSFPMYRTHHGPVTHVTEGRWTSTAMMWDPIKALEQSFVRTKQAGYKGFRKMMDLRTNSSNNTVYADAEGNIAYFHGNFMPKRDTVFDYSKPVDGADPNTDWQGLHTVDENILVLNPDNGWLQNCNSTPFTVAGEYSPGKAGYPDYMSRDQENFRGVHALSLLGKGRDITLDGLIALAHDPYLPAFEKLVPGLVEAYDSTEPKDPRLKGPVAVLRNWDLRTSEASVGMTLAHFYGTYYGQVGEGPAGASDMRLMEYLGTESPYRERLQVFSQVLDQLESAFGTWELPWGTVNRYQRLNGDIRQSFNDSLPSMPIGFASGRWGALAAFGVSYTNNTKKIFGTRGNSFVAVVEFGEKVRAKSILAGGQSSDPDSPHFNDQALRYANSQFKEVPFYREDVLKRAERTYHPGE